MKKTILLASVAAAGITAWMIKRKMSRKTAVQHLDRPHKHLTDVFSKAKQFAS